MSVSKQLWHCPCNCLRSPREVINQCRKKSKRKSQKPLMIFVRCDSHSGLTTLDLRSPIILLVTLNVVLRQEHCALKMQGSNQVKIKHRDRSISGQCYISPNPGGEHGSFAEWALAQPWVIYQPRGGWYLVFIHQGDRAPPPTRSSNIALCLIRHPPRGQKFL